VVNNAYGAQGLVMGHKPLMMWHVPQRHPLATGLDIDHPPIYILTVIIVNIDHQMRPIAPV